MRVVSLHSIVVVAGVLEVVVRVAVVASCEGSTTSQQCAGSYQGNDESLH